ncbi:MAG: glycosyltransferase family 1 protein [Gemmatimonadales bacterium]|jgi:hypothetical protein|nr:glycosyltransferase family 1 protein [Gemmatimonadales bacterium]
MGERVLIIHSWPPTPCLHGFDVGLRRLGYEVDRVGPSLDYGLAEQFRQLDPDCEYTVMEPGHPPIESLLKPDTAWVLYLYPHVKFLPTGLLDCPVPVIGWLTEEEKCAPVDERLYPWFDAAPTAVSHYSREAPGKGHDNRPCYNFIGQNWISPRYTGPRTLDMSFVGHWGLPGATDARDDDLRRVAVWCRANGVNFSPRSGIWLRDVVDLYRASKIVWSMAATGNQNLTYRVGEAFAGGALVLSPRPMSYGGLVSPLVEGEHVVFYNNQRQFAGYVRYYLQHEEGRERIGSAGAQWLRDNPIEAQVAFFVETVVTPLRGTFRERRRERAQRHGLTPEREQEDYRAYFEWQGPQPDVRQGQRGLARTITLRRGSPP